MRAALCKAAGALLVFAALIIAPAGPAQAAVGVFISGHDGRCLDSDVASPTRDGTKVQTWQCNGWNNQAWSVGPDRTIRSAHDRPRLAPDLAGRTPNRT